LEEHEGWNLGSTHCSISCYAIFRALC
jgi:hypothetical protein